LRWLEAGEVRQSANIHREVMAVACHRPVIVSLIQTLEEAGLRPAAIDIEPLALLRSGLMQFRRDDDRDKRLLFAHVGYRHTLIVIVENETPLFIKYIELGGQHFDEAVAAHFGMAPGEASTLRRTSGDRRQDQQDPEITRGVAAALRPVLDRLYEELSLCLRYHSVAFRGTPVSGVVLGGGEACPFLLEELQRRCSLKCDLSEPFRRFPMAPNVARQGQWDVAVGLGLRGLSA
jgi:type IV pilus assembly protein PilM